MIEFTYNEERGGDWEGKRKATEMALERWAESFDPIFVPDPKTLAKDVPRHEKARMQVYIYFTTGGLPTADGTTVGYDDIHFAVIPPEIVVDDEIWADYFRGTILRLDQLSSSYYGELGGKGRIWGLFSDMFENTSWDLPH